MRRGLIVALLLLLPLPVLADVFRPAYLQLREVSAEQYQVLWRVPGNGGSSRQLNPVFPAGTEQVGEVLTQLDNGAVVQQFEIRRAGGLVGQRIRISGAALGNSETIARLERADGSSQVERLSATDASFTVLPPQSATQVAWTYLLLGFEHILQGIDHLLFVLALLLIVQGARRIVATITAFTLAHSITLAAASLGWLRIPIAPVEACIALSIVFVASEVVQGMRGRSGLTARAPWLVAFSFGLLHGLGFASALSEMGLPEGVVALALLMFNIGVELGQLSFVAGVLSVVWLWRALHLAWRGRVRYVPPYAIGSLAAYWTLERVLIGFTS